MSNYKSQGIATEAFGITFRSKLEAKWAYALAALRMHGEPIKWDYVDSPWHDFVIHCPWGDAKIEIKPVGEDFLVEAIQRIPQGEILFLVMGEPEPGGDDCWVDTKVPVLCVMHDGGSYPSCESFHELSIAALERMTYAVRAFPYTVTSGVDMILIRRWNEAEDAKEAQAKHKEMTEAEFRSRMAAKRASPAVVAAQKKYDDEKKRIS